VAGTLILYAEQGLGDAIQYVRFANEARQRAGRVVFVCQPALVRLFSACANLETVVPQGAELPQADAHATLLSLPGLLKFSPSRLAELVPYLWPRADVIDHWRDELAGTEGLKVG